MRNYLSIASIYCHHISVSLWQIENVCSSSSSSPSKNFGRYNIHSKSLKMQMNSNASYLCLCLCLWIILFFICVSCRRLPLPNQPVNCFGLSVWCAAQTTCHRIIVTIENTTAVHTHLWAKEDVSPIRLQLAQCISLVLITTQWIIAELCIYILSASAPAIASTQPILIIFNVHATNANE